MNKTDFEYLRAFIREQSSIVIEDGKEYLVESRLMPLIKTENISSLETLIAQLRSQPVGPLHHKVVDAMTTNETYFFRDIHPFETLKKMIFPELIQKKALEKTLNIWCAASSSGQEPYTIAMTLREVLPNIQSWKINFIASDISENVLNYAREGVYTQSEINRGLPAPMLVKYFEKSGANWKLKPELRNMIHFKNVNLIGAWPSMPPLDLVFMRNVLIYFDSDTKKKILGRIRSILRKEGYLFLGGAETTLNLDDQFSKVIFGKSNCYKLK